MKILRTAVVGLGRIGWALHVPQILSHDGFELVAAVDTNSERLEEFKNKYGANGYADFEEMLNCENPDLVVIASPTHLHKDQAIAAMEHGADVFCDKPVAKTLDEVYAMGDAAKRFGRKIMVYQPHRAFAVVNTLKKIIAENKIGQIFMIKRANSGYTRRNDWQALKQYGGGMLNNYGAHFIDQLRYIVEEDLSVVSCMCDCVATLGDADDVVKLVMKSKSGIMLDLDINQATAYPVTGWTVFGKYGTILSEMDGTNEFKVKYIIPEECPPIEMQEGLAAAGRKYSQDPPLPWHEEIVQVEEENAIDFYEKCYEYFALDKEAFVPFEQTVKLMSLIDECHNIAGV